MEKIRVFCKNTNEYHEVAPGTKLADYLKDIGYKAGNMTVLAAYVDNELKSLNHPIYLPSSIDFITYENEDGRRTYTRSLKFLLQRAAYDLFPEHILNVGYNLPNGLYVELMEKKDTTLIHSVTQEEIEQLKDRMTQLVKMDFLFRKSKKSGEEARQIFASRGQTDKARLVETMGKFFVTTYTLDGYTDTFWGPVVYSTKDLDRWDLFKYNQGMCLQAPRQFPPYEMAPQAYQEKLFDVFQENAVWCRILGVKDIGTINKAIEAGYGKSLVNIAEALHSRKYAHIADMIYHRKEKVKLVLIAGPSSSGKTTTSKRIALQLRVLGLNPVVIGMDDYFVNRERTPRDEKGDYDFESIYALDLELLNRHINDLFNGKEVTLPKFDFEKGTSTFSGETIRLKSGDILVMEGIHALNPILTEKIADEKKFKVYASALTSLSIDENNSISTTDNRKLRRMVRDNNFRGIGAEDTLLRWQSVVAGENKNIFPYQENADIMFNSSLIYELPMLKYYAEPLLRRISPSSPVYAESLRLLNFLSIIRELNLNEQSAIPPTSIMREFIGGSSFDY